ncbi:MAG TPA: DUF1015 domain-containing protein [Armatimonadota bacterium]|jgi:uncharacterized protein (DUF1015 family)
MPDIQPFAAVRYNPDVVPLKSVVVPPYDVIKEAERARLAAEPFSGVQLTLAPSREGDTGADNRYTRARDRFEQWRREGVLIQDDRPCLYVLAQDFEWRGKAYRRSHLVCACRLHEWDEAVILPHEQILQGPKDDRQRLIETTRANFEPLFGLTLGNGETFRAALRENSQGEPIADVTLPTGERNRVWRIDHPAAIAAIQADLKERQVIIADGHHRYTASLGVKRDLNATAGPGPWDYAMMTLAAMDDPELLVLPTHRIVTGISTEFDAVIESLDEFFAIETFDSPREVEEAMEASEGIAIGMLAAGQGNYLLTPWRPEEIGDRIEGKHSKAWRSLDVSILHGIVMARVLGLGSGESPHISYTRDPAEAIQSVANGAAFAFLLKHTPTDAVRVIALGGETMPQKSTFFYPKLLTGLLMRVW